MIKYLFSLLTLFSLFCLFTACDDDDTTGGTSWDSISKTYQNKNLEAKINGMTVISAGKEVIVSASSPTEAKLTFINLLPDTEEVSISAKLSNTNEQYTVSGELKLDNCTITVNGVIDNLGILQLNINRELSTPIIGEWKLNMIANGNALSADVYAYVSTGTELDGLINSLAGPLVGQLIGGKVSAVNISFDSKGTLDFSWRKLGANQDTSLPKEYLQALNIQYVVKDDLLLLAIDKNYISLLELAAAQLEELGIKTEDILSILEDIGGYYAIPLHIRNNGTTTTFYLSKEVTAPVLEILTPILLPMLEENMRPLVENLLKLLPTAQALDFGLVFTK